MVQLWFIYGWLFKDTVYSPAPGVLPSGCRRDTAGVALSGHPGGGCRVRFLLAGTMALIMPCQAFTPLDLNLALAHSPSGTGLSDAHAPCTTASAQCRQATAGSELCKIAIVHPGL